MIRLNGRGAIYGEVWYDEEPPGDSGIDIVLFRQRDVPVPGARAAPFLSMITDLTVGEEAIFGQVGKNCREKIRRADAKDGLRTEFVAEPEGRLDEFRAFYDVFARQRSLNPCDREWLLAACKARQLAMTCATRDGAALVWHAYFINGRVACLRHTASCFRDRENDYRALVGRGNRWLHWKDILRFREMGFERYDWGGLFEDESAPDHAGINRFKMEFGGRRVRTYDCVLPVTLKGRVYLPLRNAWRRLNAGRS